MKVRLKTKRDGEPVPRIYRHDHTCEINQLLFIKMRCHSIVVLVVNTVLCQSRQGFGPTQCGAFALGEYRHFWPGSQYVQALLLLAIVTRLLCMHVLTKCTAIDLRSTYFYQMQKLGLQAFSDRLIKHRERFQ